MASPLETIKSAVIGIPPQADKTPSRQGVVKAFAEMQTQLDAAQAGAIVKNDLSALTALSTAPYAGIMAWVVNDATQSNNGIYENTGTASTPAWTKRSEIPSNVVSAVNIGAGTADAIEADTDLALPSGDGKTLIILNITANNTGAVTLELNSNGTALVMKDVAGNAINTADQLVSGMTVAGYITNSGADFRLITDHDSAANLAAALAAQTAAETAAAGIVNSIKGSSAVYTSDHTVVSGDAGLILIANKATAIEFPLTAVATLGDGFQTKVHNKGAGDLTLTPDGSETINGASSLVIGQHQSATIWIKNGEWFASSTLTADNYLVSNPIEGDLFYDPSSGGNGFFTDYECKTAFKWQVQQAKDNTGTGESGVTVDAFTIHSVDDDTADYTSAGVRAISNGLRVLINGAWNGAGFDAQTKDLVAIDAHAIGNITDNNRGVSGIATGAIQYGTAIASNEFAVENPATASAQSVSMAGVQAIVRARYGAADASHIYSGVLIQNDQGYLITAGLRLITTPGVGSLNGQFLRGIDMVETVVTDAAIKMPRGGGTGDGVIDYATNYYTNFVVGASRFDTIANGNVRSSTGNNGFAAGIFHQGFAFLEIAPGTSAIGQVYIPDSVAPSSPLNGHFWVEGGVWKWRYGGVTNNVTMTPA